MAGLWQPPGYNGSVIPEVSANLQSTSNYRDKKGEKNLIVRIFALIGKNLGNINAWPQKHELVSRGQQSLQ